ncbi:MAG TPA: lasso peptide biosynthesis B2 protein [Rhizomicrobium sp.]
MARQNSIRHPLRRFAKVGGDRRRLVVEAVLYLLAARLALVVIPFPRLAKRLGAFVPPSDPRAKTKGDEAPAEHAALAREIGWAVTRAARHVPFRAVCLPQAMAAQFMLRGRGVATVLHFGAGRGADKPLEAHAWLDAAGVEVTGYPVPLHLAEIACFV